MNPGDDGVAISRVVETAASWDGAPLPSYPRGAPRVTILRATVPPHTALAKVKSFYRILKEGIAKLPAGVRGVEMM